MTDPTQHDRSVFVSTIERGESPRTTPLDGPPPASRMRQVLALGGGEWRLLRRNKVALINTLLVPGLMVAFLAMLGATSGLSLGVMAPLVILHMALVFTVYYTLVTAVVARRESSVLSRLRTGEASDGVILAGLSGPFVLATIVQTVLCVLGAVVLLDAAMPANALLIVAAMALGCLAWALLGLASTIITRSVEHAQITTMPLITIALVFSGSMFPVAIMPDVVQTIASFTPLHPVGELMRLGMAGTDADGAALSFAETCTHALRPSLVLLAWSALGAWLVRTRMPWSPRR